MECYQTLSFPMTLSDVWRSFRWPTLNSMSLERMKLCT